MPPKHAGDVFLKQYKVNYGMIKRYLYQKMGFTPITKPEGVIHATMNRFYIKELGQEE